MLKCYLFARDSPSAGARQVTLAARFGKVRTPLVESGGKWVRLSAERRAPLRHFRIRDHACDVIVSATESVGVDGDCYAATAAAVISISPTQTMSS